MRPTLLFISVSDGTDTRIFKEIKSLNNHFQITFIGIKTPTSTADMLPQSCHKIFIQGIRRSPLTLAKLFIQVARQCPWRFNSVHVINENLALVVYPLLILSRHWVLDIFDSLFLKSTSRLTSFSAFFLKKIIYGSANVILVTDEARLNLLPPWAKKKAFILPNYPLGDNSITTERTVREGALTIFLSGSISSDRGIPCLLNLLNLNPHLNVQAAGWVYDKESEALIRHPQVKYHGVIHQTAAAQLAKRCDYIFCLYEPNNANNINASPNKIYDGIQAGVPVIINQEVLASSFVRSEKLGIVLESYNPVNIANVNEQLISQRNNFTHIIQMKGRYTWEKVESVILKAHLISQN